MQPCFSIAKSDEWVVKRPLPNLIACSRGNSIIWLRCWSRDTAKTWRSVDLALETTYLNIVYAHYSALQRMSDSNPYRVPMYHSYHSQSNYSDHQYLKWKILSIFRCCHLTIYGILNILYWKNKKKVKIKPWIWAFLTNMSTLKLQRWTLV